MVQGTHRRKIADNKTRAKTRVLTYKSLSQIPTKLSIPTQKPSNLVIWRWVEDSNLRGDFSPTAFGVRRVRPLCQPTTSHKTRHNVFPASQQARPPIQPRFRVAP